MNIFASDRYSSSSYPFRHRERPGYWINPIAFFTTGLTLLMQLPAWADLAQTPADPNVYPPQEVQAFMEGCVSNATAQGLERNFSQNYCACTINALQTRYTYAEFTELALVAQSTQQPPAELMEVAQLCVPR